MHKKLLLLSLLFAPILLVACSSSGDSSKQEAVRITQEYAQAQELGNWEKMCSLLAAASREAVRTQIAQTGSGKPASCAAALRGASASTRRALQQTAEGVRAQSARISGDKALVRTETRGGSKDVELLREGGSWRVSLVPADK